MNKLAQPSNIPFTEPMPQTIYDAVVIGGGPGGSAAATYLSKAGKRVLIIEREHFPRFHIGESLLPYNQKIFREMGVLPALEAAGFPQKNGAQFHLGTGLKSIKMAFANGCFTMENQAIQVERAKFDDILLKHARDSGTEVREGWTVTNFSRTNDSVEIEAQAEDGKKETFSAAFLIDASGRGNVTGNLENLRVMNPRLKKLAVFAHFEGVKLDEGTKRGDTVIVRLDAMWFWIIPVSADKTSVGCVMDTNQFTKAKLSPEEIFHQIVNSSQAIRERMSNAHVVGEFHVTSDFSYYNRKIVGPRLLRVGDAAGFLDPIFSTGVYLAMQSGKSAAENVLASLAAGDDGTNRFKKFERVVLRNLKFYEEMVMGFYTTPFMEVFMEPKDKFQLPAAVLAFLAGETEGGWKLYWRRKLFFLLIKIQALHPFLTRIRNF